MGTECCRRVTALQNFPLVSPECERAGCGRIYYKEGSIYSLQFADTVNAGNFLEATCPLSGNSLRVYF